MIRKIAFGQNFETLYTFQYFLRFRVSFFRCVGTNEKENLMAVLLK